MEVLIEGVDYYINEDNYWVFTEAYHLKRGKCCKNICKHCPWNFGRNKPKEKDNKDEKS